MSDKICGVVERTIFKNDDNGYHVLSVLRSDTEKECVVTTNHLKIAEGLSYQFEGQWITTSKFGHQFKSERVTEIQPSTNDAMIKYLSSSFFKGVGPVLANKIVKHFKENTYEILKADINRLTEVSGISKKKFEVIKKAWQENGEINEIMVFLQSYDISTLYASKIYEFFGKDCIVKIKSNPYTLTQIEGIGFKYADKIALSFGFKKDCIERIGAGIKFILEESENNDGHCFLYYNQIISKSVEVLGVAIENKIDVILQELILNNEIKISKINEEQRFYSNKIYYAERNVANKIHLINNFHGNVYNEEIIKEWKDNLLKSEIILSEEQKDAISGIIYEKISVITGGAGSGKTTCLKQLVDLLDLLKVDFLIACPTGKAAMRVTEVTKNVASTHKLLGWNHFENNFMYNRYNQLTCQFLIIDEASMINIQLMNSLLDALPNNCHILLSGDFQQLSPIGAGAPFRDIIVGEILKVFRLTQTFRQANGFSSDIIKFANEIIKGVDPIIESPFESPELWTTNKKDCLFIDSGAFEEDKTFSDYPDWHSLRYGYDIIEMIKKLYLDIIPKYYPDKKIQIISPMNKGNFGCNNINNIIREIVNPQSNLKMELNLKTRILREGDIVINVVNNYDLGISNGEIGVIKSIDVAEKKAIIEFEYESKNIEFKRSDLLHIRHAYAVSCHKFQGSESPIIIAPLSMAHYPLLYRSMIYTLITRGKSLVVIVGERNALKVAVNNIRDNQRQTSLIELIKMKG